MAKRRRKKKSSSFRFFVFLAMAVGVIFFINTKTAESSLVIPTKPTTKSSTEWWDANYGYRVKLSDPEFVINHAKLVVDGKSNSDASDLKVVTSVNGDQFEIPANIKNPDSVNSEVSFDKTSSAGDEYYLYYGNKIPASVTSQVENNLNVLNPKNLTMEEERPVILLKNSKKWVIKDNENKHLTFELDSEKALNADSKYYVIIDGSEEKLSVKPINNIIKIDITELAIGKHSVFVIVENEREVMRSNTLSFYLSAPVYIAWTIDWEGVDPQQKYLDMMAKISDEFKIKMTHYFNPRILTSLKISETRKRELVNWVKNRASRSGEEIGMHMHMQHDLVEEAGIKAKYNAPTWDGGLSGYDIPSSEYSYDEYLKLLKWALNKFKEYGLPTPKGYRTGGWFADMDNLRAIEDAGFVYDTSSRVSFGIGKNKVFQQWNISNTSQPYYPNINDQNSSLAPNMKLLEVPNNGADSYWSNAQEMLQNFYANYSPNSTIDKSVLLVYLSHPEWFEIDDPKLRELFAKLSDYRYDMDRGPVKFVTIEEWISLTSSASDK